MQTRVTWTPIERYQFQTLYFFRLQNLIFELCNLCIFELYSILYFAFGPQKASWHPAFPCLLGRWWRRWRQRGRQRASWHLAFPCLLGQWRRRWRRRGRQRASGHPAFPCLLEWCDGGRTWPTTRRPSSERICCPTRSPRTLTAIAGQKRSQYSTNSWK